MRLRKQNTGLPYRLYERYGLKIYSIGYKGKQNKWLFRLQCDVTDNGRIKQLRREAIVKSVAVTSNDGEIVTVEQLFKAYFDRLDKLLDQPRARRGKKASTIAENKREAATLCTAFGQMAITHVRYHHAASYQDKCDELGRGAKADKELTLLSRALDLARRRGIIDINPLTDLEKLPPRPSERYVTHEELELAVEVGRSLGGAAHIIALALQTAYLCIRRSVEVRDLKKSDICPDGIWWTNGKTPFGETPRKVLIEWTPELRELVQEACAVRPLTALGPYIFGNLQGDKYTKGGWKPGLARLMAACEKVAAARGEPFRRFSLMDLRAKGVSDKLDSGESVQEVQTATMHKSPRMVNEVYDRRKTGRAKPISSLKPDQDGDEL